MMIRKIAAGCMVLVVSGTAVAQGSFDFDNIPGVNQEPAVVVDINPVMMQFFINTIAPLDPEGANILRGLRSIKMRVYREVENARQFNTFIDDVSDELGDEGWMPVVSTQDDESKVRIYMQMTGEEVSGMTVMLTGGTEAVFINLDGTVSAADLGAILAKLPVQDVLSAFPLQSPMPMPTPAPRAQPSAD